MVDCWASLYGGRSLFYRRSKDLAGEPSLGVVVQVMVPSERSGVMFTIDPSTGERDRLVIEAAFGQGEVVVSGQVEPDTYVVAKEGLRVCAARVGNQAFEIVRGPDGRDLRRELGPVEGGRRVLSDEEVVDLARLGLGVEAHYGSPQDTEWAMAGGRTYLVQSRPVTAAGAGPPALRGAGRDPGAGSGRLRRPGLGCRAGPRQPRGRHRDCRPARCWWPP